MNFKYLKCENETFKMVKGEGNKKCKFAIIGEAPGSEEELEGRPFIGASGQFLNTKLSFVGISRDDCYITNLVKVRPPENDFSIYWKGHTPTQDLLKWKALLLKELDELDTNIFLALGSNALWALTDKKHISKWRGSILPLTLPSGRSIKVIGTYHPSACLRDWKLGAIVTYDLRRVIEESTTPSISFPKRTVVISPSFEEASSYLTILKDVKEFAFDIETSHGEIICISFSHSPDYSMSIPTMKWYWKENFKAILEGIEGVMHSKNRKIAQNILFDTQYIMRNWHIFPKGEWDDTMIMAHSAYSELPKALDFLTSIYTKEPYYKDDLKVWRENQTSNEILWQYNAKDAMVCIEIAYALRKEVEELGTRKTYDFMMSLLKPLLFMMLHGLRVDEEAVGILRTQLQQDIGEKEGRVKKTTGGINIYSPKQLANLAINTLHLKPTIKDGKVTMNEKSLNLLSLQSPFFKEIISLRKDKKIISTYLDTERDFTDGRLRFSINPVGTTTGRLSSSSSVFGHGTNIQNFPKFIRNIIIPDEGKMFSEIDLVGAEAMVVAFLSDDKYLMKLFMEGKNIHTYTATLIWNISSKEVEKEKEEGGDETKTKYYMAKRLRHAYNYRASWVAVKEQLSISAKEAKDLIHKFEQANPFLKKWHQKIEAQIRKNKVIITPFGRKRIFFDRVSESMLREAIAFIPQDTVSYVINTFMKRIYKTLCMEQKDTKILLQVHDSLLLEYLPSMKEEIHKRLFPLAHIPIPFQHGFFTIPIKIKSGYNWRDLS